jgi:hypothetical protein
MSKEQISKEFARNKLLQMPPIDWDEFFIKRDSEIILKYWERAGYIKQSREEEIREELNKYYSGDDEIYSDFYANTAIQLQKELIQILDNKDKA